MDGGSLVAAATAALGFGAALAEPDPAGRATLDETIGLEAHGGLLVPVPGPGAGFAVRSFGSSAWPRRGRSAAARLPSSPS